jgi:hypothetical protein
MESLESIGVRSRQMRHSDGVPHSSDLGVVAVSVLGFLVVLAHERLNTY